MPGASPYADENLNMNDLLDLFIGPDDTYLQLIYRQKLSEKPPTNTDEFDDEIMDRVIKLMGNLYTVEYP